MSRWIKTDLIQYVHIIGDVCIGKFILKNVIFETFNIQQFFNHFISAELIFT